MAGTTIQKKRSCIARVAKSNTRISAVQSVDTAFKALIYMKCRSWTAYSTGALCWRWRLLLTLFFPSGVVIRPTAPVVWRTPRGVECPARCLGVREREARHSNCRARQWLGGSVSLPAKVEVVFPAVRPSEALCHLVCISFRTLKIRQTFFNPCDAKF